MRKAIPKESQKGNSAVVLMAKMAPMHKEFTQFSYKVEKTRPWADLQSMRI